MGRGGTAVDPAIEREHGRDRALGLEVVDGALLGLGPAVAAFEFCELDHGHGFRLSVLPDGLVLHRHANIRRVALLGVGRLDDRVELLEELVLGQLLLALLALKKEQLVALGHDGLLQELFERNPSSEKTQKWTKRAKTRTGRRGHRRARFKQTVRTTCRIVLA